MILITTVESISMVRDNKFPDDYPYNFLEFTDLYHYVHNLHGSFNSVTSSSMDRGINFSDAQNILKNMHGPAFVAAPALLYSIWRMYDQTGTGKLDYK